MVEALREHGLVERTLISSKWMRSLVVLRALEPRLRLGWSVPRLQAATPTQSLADQAARPTPAPRYVRATAAGRRRRRTSAPGRCDALMAHWRLVTPRLVRGGHARPAASSTCGRSTTAPRIGRLERLGVTGVITNDPRLFAQLPSAQVAAE